MNNWQGWFLLINCLILKCFVFVFFISNYICQKFAFGGQDFYLHCFFTCIFLYAYLIDIFVFTLVICESKDLFSGSWGNRNLFSAPDWLYVSYINQNLKWVVVFVFWRILWREREREREKKQMSLSTDMVSMKFYENY